MPAFVKKEWGSEEIIANGIYCGKRMTLNKGYRCSIHYHAQKHETFFVEKGSMLVEIEEEPHKDRQNKELKKLKPLVMNKGDVLVIQPNTAHRFTGLDDNTVFFEFSTHDMPEDSIRITTSEKVPGHEFEQILATYGP